MVALSPAIDRWLPSGNGVAAQVFMRLFVQTQMPRYRDRAEAILTALIGPNIDRIGYAGALNRALALFVRESEKLMANNRLLIIGASGFLGHALCDVSCDGWERVPASRSGKGHLFVDLTRSDLVHEVVAQVRPPVGDQFGSYDKC